MHLLAQKELLFKKELHFSVRFRSLHNCGNYSYFQANHSSVFVLFLTLYHLKQGLDGNGRPSGNGTLRSSGSFDPSSNPVIPVNPESNIRKDFETHKVTLEQHILNLKRKVIFSKNIVQY